MCAFTDVNLEVQIACCTPVKCFRVVWNFVSALCEPKIVTQRGINWVKIGIIFKKTYVN